jgi:hypothetical protein
VTATKTAALVVAWLVLAVSASLVVDRDGMPSATRHDAHCEASTELPTLPLRMARNEVIGLRRCGAVAVRVHARGEEAAGRGSQLVLASGRFVDARVLVGPGTASASLDPSGWFAIGFVNDRSDGEGDRGLWIDAIEFVDMR